MGNKNNERRARRSRMKRISRSLHKPAHQRCFLSPFHRNGARQTCPERGTEAERDAETHAHPSHLHSRLSNSPITLTAQAIERTAKPSRVLECLLCGICILSRRRCRLCPPGRIWHPLKLKGLSSFRRLRGVGLFDMCEGVPLSCPKRLSIDRNRPERSFRTL